MRVALYQPFVPDGNTTPMLGLLYLAAVLEQNGFEVRLFDARIDRKAFLKLVSFRPELVGISTVTAAYPSGLRVARKLKEMFPQITIAFGGPHPSSIPEDVLAEPCVDYVFVGESERSFPKLCQLLRDRSATPDALREVTNMVFRVDGEKIHTWSQPVLSDDELDGLPRPAYHTMDMDSYFAASQTHGLFHRGKRILPIMSSRGCPQSCTFCCRVLGRKIRGRSVDSVLSELHWLVDTYGIDEVYFEDDNFTTQRKRALEILDHLAGLKPPVNVKFANGVRVDRVDSEILAAMKRARVYSLSFGIESGSPATLKKMKKGLDLELARENILLAKSMGFLVGANCIIGYPGETLEDIEQSLDFFFGLPLDSMAIVNLVPFPGTEVRRQCEEQGFLTEAAKDWGSYFFSLNRPIPLIETPQLSGDQLVSAIRRAYRRMYLSPRFLSMALRNLSLSQMLKGAPIVLGLGNGAKDHDPEGLATVEIEQIECRERG